MKFGSLIQVYSEEKGRWVHRYLSHFDEKGRACVFVNGMTPYTATTRTGEQLCELDPEILDGPINTLFHFEKYEQHRSDFVVKSNVDIVPAGETARERLYRGMLIQVRYEENEPWRYAYLDRFWSDGRIQVIAMGRTPYTEEDHEGVQRHESNHGHVEHMWPFVTMNFWRQATEITDSGDLRSTERYETFWAPRLEHRE